MKNRRISVQISKTINTGNYESVKLQAGIEADILDTDTLENQYGLLWEFAENELITKENEIFGQKTASSNSMSSRIANRKPKMRR